MKKIFYVLAFVFALTYMVSAQTTLRVGPFAGYTTSNDKFETQTQDGGDFFPGVTASANFREGKRVEFRVRADIARPQLPTLFTTDEGAERPEYELRLNPEARLNLGKFFAGVGFDSFYHGGLHNDPGEEYSRSYGVNPTASVGVNFTSKQEVAYTYILRDKGTDLYGHRIDYFYTLSEKFPVRVGFQANYLTFKERDREGYVDPYYEKDITAKLSVEIPLKRGKK